MTEEQALEFWRGLAVLGIDAMVTREHRQAPGDDPEFEVVVWARRLHGKVFFEFVRAVEHKGFQMSLETEGFGEDPIYSVFQEKAAT